MSYAKERSKVRQVLEETMPQRAEKPKAENKAEALAKRIQEIERFITARFSLEESEAIRQALLRLKESLKAEKLSVQIVSPNLAQAQEFQKLLGFHELAGECCEIQASVLPNLFDSSLRLPLPFLSWQEADKQACFELSQPGNQIIGRNPVKAQAVLADRFNLVSGCHAELRFVDEHWQIRDLDSRNGTYINGKQKKLQGWHQLETGDQIYLGSNTEVEGGAVLVFEQPTIPINAVEVDRILDCDVLCLLIEPGQPLTENAKCLLERANQAQITKQFIIAGMPGNDISDEVATNLGRIADWVRDQFKLTSLELVSLLLKPVIPDAKATVLIPYTQPKFEQFCQSLVSLANDKTDEVVLRRVASQLLAQIAAIETLLNQKATALNRRIQREEEKLQELGQGNLKELSKKAIDAVDSEINQFFRQVKSEVNQSKSDLLYRSRENSLPHKVQQFIRKLQPVTVLKRGLCSVRLALKRSADVHATAIHLYQSELQNWTTVEWKRICKEYNDGGLSRLLSNSYRTLNCIPGLNLPITLFQPPQPINIELVLQVPTLPPDCGFEASYKQASFSGHLYKKLKSEVMTVSMFVVLIGGGIGVYTGWNLERARITLPILPIVGFLLYGNYKEEKAAKLEEATEKLQKELTSFYQQRAEELADRLAQHLASAWDAEERRLKKTLDLVKERYATYIAELEKSQLPLKAQLENYKKVQLKQIVDGAAEIEKLKRELSLI